MLWTTVCSQVLTLHPIMFLLNQKPMSLKRVTVFFTSHYVPIKSQSQRVYNQHQISLHPIMFLLNLDQHEFHSGNIAFTSHYVPIKSKESKRRCIWKRFTLHPIMFLLNLYKCSRCSATTYSFTSHYVPIKSSRDSCKVTCKCLYIPLCSY